jgi:hypothetical protein
MRGTRRTLCPGKSERRGGRAAAFRKKNLL